MDEQTKYRRCVMDPGVQSNPHPLPHMTLHLHILSSVFLLPPALKNTKHKTTEVEYYWFCGITFLINDRQEIHAKHNSVRSHVNWSSSVKKILFLAHGVENCCVCKGL